LEYTKAKSWFEEELQKLSRKGDWELMWVKGHDGMKGKRRGRQDWWELGCRGLKSQHRPASNKPSPSVAHLKWKRGCTGTHVQNHRLWPPKAVAMGHWKGGG